MHPVHRTCQLSCFTEIIERHSFSGFRCHFRVLNKASQLCFVINFIDEVLQQIEILKHLGRGTLLHRNLSHVFNQALLLSVILLWIYVHSSKNLEPICYSFCRIAKTVCFQKIHNIPILNNFLLLYSRWSSMSNFCRYCVQCNTAKRW